MKWRHVVTRAAVITVVTTIPLMLLPTAQADNSSPRVLRVGAWRGVPGDFDTIQAAVNAAEPTDWILVGEGDYHEHASQDSGVLIRTPGLHLRGMDRNEVVIDGTLPDHDRCDAAADAQDFGPLDGDNHPVGRNGIVVDPAADGSADGVTIENLTVCNFLSSADGHNGNEIWWNGGDGTGHQWLGGFGGDYLTATTTYSDLSGGAPAATYGIFVSNTHGPGAITQSSASNMADAAFYVGACPDCNVTLDHVRGQHSAQGYSGTNSGGHLLITDSEFDDNLKGIAPNSQNDDDAPSPQDGACPSGSPPPADAHTCEVIRNNLVHDNNDPSVPRLAGITAAGIGTGIIVAGGRNDTIIDNVVTHNGLFGIVVADIPDTETPPPIANCAGGTQLPGVCYFQAIGNEIAHNSLDGNGFFGNNGDADLALGAISLMPGNCFHDNTSPSGKLTSTPPSIQTVDGHCGGPSVADARTGVQLACAGTLAAEGGPNCVGMHYPTATGVTLVPMTAEPTMPAPCTDVPANPWCPGPYTTRSTPRTSSLARTGTSIPEPLAVALISLALALRLSLRTIPRARNTQRRPPPTDARTLRSPRPNLRS